MTHANDAELIQAALENQGIDCQITQVQTKGDYVSALEGGGIDQDDNAIRELTTEMLIGFGYQVDGAADGAIGWEALQAKPL